MIMKMKRKVKTKEEEKVNEGEVKQEKKEVSIRRIREEEKGCKRRVERRVLKKETEKSRGGRRRERSKR